MTDIEKLKGLLPCPFCGGDELGYGWSSLGMDGSMSTGDVQCFSCNAFVIASTEREAIEAWNRRAATTERTILRTSPDSVETPPQGEA